MSLQPLFGEDAPAWSMSPAGGVFAEAAFGQPLGGFPCGGADLRTARPSRAAVFRQPASSASLQRRQPDRTYTKAFRSRQLGQAPTAAPHLSASRRTAAHIRAARPSPGRRAFRSPAAERPYLTGLYRGRQPEAEPPMSNLAVTDDLFFERTGMDRGPRRADRRRGARRAWTTASCSSNTASRKASRSTTAGSRAPRSTRRRASGCARWPARRPATPMPPNCPRRRSGAPRRRCAPSRAAMPARSPSRRPAPTARSTPI